MSAESTLGLMFQHAILSPVTHSGPGAEPLFFALVRPLEKMPIGRG